MFEPLFLIALCFGIFLSVIIFIAIVVAVIEMITGTALGQWPEKIHAFFKRRGWVADRNHQI